MATTKTVLVVMTAVITLPAAVSYTWAHITKDPSLRPLGITQQGIQEFEARDGEDSLPRQVRTTIVYNPDRHRRLDRFSRQIKAGFAAKSVQNEVVLEVADVETVEITFQIGATILGPMGPDEVPHWIVAASEAFKVDAQ